MATTKCSRCSRYCAPDVIGGICYECYRQEQGTLKLTPPTQNLPHRFGPASMITNAPRQIQAGEKFTIELPMSAHHVLADLLCYVMSHTVVDGKDMVDEPIKKVLLGGGVAQITAKRGGKTFAITVEEVTT